LNAPHSQRVMQELVSNVDQIRRSWFFLAFQVPNLPEWMIRLNLKNFLKNMLQEQAIRKGAFSRSDTEIYQAALEKPGALAAAIAYYRQLLSPQTWMQSLSQTIQPVTAPTLVLWGEEDGFLSHQLTEGLEKMIAAPFRFKRIPHCGHWIQQEVPQTVNRELLQFLCQTA
ncbi:MAG: alpha/beta hydrolase, partial [Cyanothece sp. SIO2G6]|nr:alpha/beta hydrolase [Cyanothece sp. SIO2G6]